MKKPIYLDYAATTPLDKRVLEAMLPIFTENFGNPSSVHRVGQRAEAALEIAREIVAEKLNCKLDEVIFTGCGTESDNLAIRGRAYSRREKNGANRILTTPVEHHAVGHTVEQLGKRDGFRIEYLPVDKFGMVDPGDLQARIDSDVAVVSIIYANNEIGTINPISELGQICRNFNISFHTDAVQAAAHLPMDVERDYVDFLSLGGHKFYGPKGVGVLYKSRQHPLLPVQTGGGQEYGVRAGTQNVAYIVGLAEAFRIAQDDVLANEKQLVPLRDLLIDSVLSEIPNVKLTGHPRLRLPNHASFIFHGVDGNGLLMRLDSLGFACSSGSACKVGDPKPSDVLLSIGVTEDWALGSLRVTLGRATTQEDILEFLDVLPGAVYESRGNQS